MMEKKRSIGIRVVGIIMFIYAFWLLGGSILKIPPLYIFYLKFAPIVIRKIFLYTGPPLVKLPFAIPLIGLIYLVSSIGILRIKNWGRMLALYFSTFLLLPIAFIIISIIPTIIKGKLENYEAIGVYFALYTILPLLPSFIFLIFFTRPKVKEQFK